MKDDTKPSITLSISRKIPMEQYGSAEAFISLKDLTAETTQAEIDTLLSVGGLGFKAMSASMTDKIKEFKSGGI